MREINDTILDQVSKIHFVGIGGSGMCPLAEILHSKGYQLTGSDVSAGDNIDRARSIGIPVTLTHRAENVGDAELLVYTAAVHADNPELQAAAERGIPTLERSRLLGMLTRRFDYTIAVAGTHGKTTTTSMISHVMMLSNADPTIVIGGRLPLIGTNGRAGKSDLMVCEACEYVDTFLQLNARMSVILNIDADHLDYFGTLENIIKSFRKFAERTSHTLVVNGDDANSIKAARGLGREIITFGLDASNDYTAADLTQHGGSYYEFTLVCKGEKLARLHLGVPGRHNVYNALAAAAALHQAGISPDDIAAHFATFSGAGRRFEQYGTFAGVTLADDYAHHPNEIIATLDAASCLPYKRVWAIFQPFTFSRTVQWLDEFADALKKADRVILAEIMGSRELNTYNISSQDLALKIPGSVCLDSFEEIASYIAEHAEPGDFVITMGGGDIYKAARMIRDRLSAREIHTS